MFRQNVSDGECLVKLVDIGMGGASFHGEMSNLIHTHQLVFKSFYQQKKILINQACSQINAKIIRVTDDH